MVFIICTTECILGYNLRTEHVPDMGLNRKIVNHLNLCFTLFLPKINDKI